jgi:uncharacterized Tic20 family protein
MDAPATTTLQSDEKIWAALAHASVLLFFFGPLIPLVVWSTQRRKSSFVSFHALQAMSYQVLWYWFWILVGPVLMMLLFGAFILLAALSPTSADEPGVFALGMQVVIWGGILGSFALYMLLGVVGAGFCVAGREFRYPLMGRWTARFLDYQAGGATSLNEANEDRLVASLGHATAIITLWGLIFSLIAWVSEKERSLLLRFQLLQAVIYQGIGAVGYMGAMMLYMVMVFGMMAVMFSFDSSAPENLGPLAAVLFILPILFIFFVFFVLGPIFLLLASWASLRVLRGHDYHYPFLGRFLARRMGSAPPAGAGATQ